MPEKCEWCKKIMTDFEISPEEDFENNVGVLTTKGPNVSKCTCQLGFVNKKAHQEFTEAIFEANSQYNL